MTAAVDLHRWETGQGEAVLCIHETGTSSEIWRALAEARGEGARTIAYDRRGWGRSGAPEPYLGTTVQEQSEDAALLLEESDASAAVLCGAGLGAVAALDLLLRRPELARGAVLIEPPLMAFVEEATELLSEDGGALREAVHLGGPAAGVELYLSGKLTALGAGAERLPRALSAPARERPLTLFAELAAVPSWSLPLAELAENRIPVFVVGTESSPPLLSRAAEGLTGRLAQAELRELRGGRAGHVEDPGGLAELILEFA